MLRTALIAATLLATACGPARPPHAAEPPAPPAPPAPAAPIATAGVPAQVAGSPVFLLASEDGVVARTVDGSWTRSLVSEPVSYPLYDPRLGLLWFIHDDALAVLDLRIDDAQPTRIVEGMPAIRYQIVHQTASASHLIEAGDPHDNLYLTLHWSDAPGLAVEAPTEDFVRAEETAAARAARIVGGEWLAAQRKRGVAPVPDAHPFYAEPPQRLTSLGLPAISECADDCGLAVDFLATAWKLVIVYNACSDFCYFGCMLYDPATGKVASPITRRTEAGPDWVPLSAEAIDLAGPCGSYRAAPVGDHFARLGGERLCHATGDCQRMAGAFLGFVGGGATYGSVL